MNETVATQDNVCLRRWISGDVTNCKPSSLSFKEFLIATYQIGHISQLFVAQVGEWIIKPWQRRFQLIVSSVQFSSTPVIRRFG